MSLDKSVLKRHLEEAVLVSNLGSKIWCGQTYNEVFSGEVLVNAFVADVGTFADRNSALEYAQILLDKKVITCITKCRKFDDSDRLYCVDRIGLGKFDADVVSNAARNLPSDVDTQGKRNSHEKTNGLHKPNGKIELTYEMNGLRTSSLQKLLEKDAKKSSVSGPAPVPTLPRNYSGKNSHSFVAIKDETSSKSNNDERLTANQTKVAQSKQKSDSQMSRNGSIILPKTPKLEISLEDNVSKIGNMHLKNTSATKKSETESNKSEGKKLKLRKSLSPSLNALVEKDNQNSQGFKQENSKEIDIISKRSATVNDDDEKETSSPDKISNSWKAFELKLQTKVKKSAEKPNCGVLNTRGALEAHGNRGVKDARVNHSGNVEILLEDSTKRSSEKERQNISVKIENEAGNSEESSDRSKTKISSHPIGQKVSRESAQVKLSVYGDELLFPSVRERKNSFRNEDEQNGSTTTTRERVHSFTKSDKYKAFVLDDGGRNGNESWKQDGKVVIENGSTLNDLPARSVQRTLSQSVSKEVSAERRSLSGEVSLENSKWKHSQAALRNTDDNEMKNGETVSTDKKVLTKQNSKQHDNEIIVLENSRLGSVSRSLADLIAKDEPSDSKTTSKMAVDDNSPENVYKEKLKGLKKTTSYYIDEPINVDANKVAGSGRSKANGETREHRVEHLSNGSVDVLDGNVNDRNNVMRRLDDGSNGEALKPASLESNSPRTTKQEKENEHEILGQVIVPRLNLENPHHPVSPVAAARPNSLDVVASSPVNDANSSPARELEKRVAEFELEKRGYEMKITELQLQLDYVRRQKSGQLDDSGSISDITSLYSPYSTPVMSPGNSNVTSPFTTPQATPRGSLLQASPKSPVPPPPPTPPFVPAPPPAPENNLKPSKPVLKPSTEMKPLFWQRIIASGESPNNGKCIWQSIREPAVDANEFEKLFSKKVTDRRLRRTKSLRDDKHFAHINGKKVAKLLETDRSRAIGIKMSSLSCQLEDVRNAVYNMDTSIVDMESLQSIYDIYPKKEEVEMIVEYLKKIPSVPLDKPEEFMHQLTKMKHFKERLECWLFQDKFSEIIYGIERSLACVIDCCNVITTNSEITILLSLVLAYGNYMNGNTQRGQADGFHLDVLLKLKDVKAKDSDINLLQYTVKQYQKLHERNLPKNKGESRLPSPVSLYNAAQVSFEKLKEELTKLSQLLKETEAQVEKILDECPPAQRNPFEDNMRVFQTTAKHKISEQKEKLFKAENKFREAVEYFRCETNEKKENPQEFFGLWAKFVEEVKTCMKMEKQQHEISKKNFSKVEHLNQIREAATKFKRRRQSEEILT